VILSAVNVDVDDEEEAVEADAVDDAEVVDDDNGMEDINDDVSDAGSIPGVWVLMAICGVFVLSRFSRDKVRRIRSIADSVFVVVDDCVFVDVLVIGMEEDLCKTLVFVFFFCCCSNSLFVKACR